MRLLPPQSVRGPFSLVVEVRIFPLVHPPLPFPFMAHFFPRQRSRFPCCLRLKIPPTSRRFRSREGVLSPLSTNFQLLPKRNGMFLLPPVKKLPPPFLLTFPLPFFPFFLCSFSFPYCPTTTRGSSLPPP